MILPLSLIFFEQRDPFYFYTSYFKFCNTTWGKKVSQYFCQLCWKPWGWTWTDFANHKSFFAQQQSRSTRTQGQAGKKTGNARNNWKFLTYIYIEIIFEHTTGRRDQNLARIMPKPLISCPLCGLSRLHRHLVLFPASASLMWNSVHDYLWVNGRQIERKKTDKLMQILPRRARGVTDWFDEYESHLHNSLHSAAVTDLSRGNHRRVKTDSSVCWS